MIVVDHDVSSAQDADPFSRLRRILNMLAFARKKEQSAIKEGLIEIMFQSPC